MCRHDVPDLPFDQIAGNCTACPAFRNNRAAVSLRTTRSGKNGVGSNPLLPGLSLRVGCRRRMAPSQSVQHKCLLRATTWPCCITAPNCCAFCSASQWVAAERICNPLNGADAHHGCGTALPYGKCGARLNSQTFAAFGAAGIEHGATAACFHANQKAVCACAADFGRLVSTFHGHGDTFWDY